MCIPYTTLDSYTTFLEQRASNNLPDILRNFVRMRQQWFPGERITLTIISLPYAHPPTRKLVGGALGELARYLPPPRLSIWLIVYTPRSAVYISPFPGP